MALFSQSRTVCLALSKPMQQVLHTLHSLKGHAVASLVARAACTVIVDDNTVLAPSNSNLLPLDPSSSFPRRPQSSERC